MQLRIEGRIALLTGASKGLALAVAKALSEEGATVAISFTLEQWRAAYERLLLGAVSLIEAALPGIRERNWGRVLSLSSGSSASPVPCSCSRHRTGPDRLPP